MADTSESTEDEASLPVTTWLDRLGGKHGSPGGGAACAVLVAVSSALMAMVAGYSTDDERVAAALERLVAVRGRALEASEADSRRSGELGAALRESSSEGSQGDPDADPVPEAALTAAQSAVQLGELAASLVPELELLLDVAETYLLPDLVVAAESAAAALGGTAATVRADVRLAEAHGFGADHPAIREVAAGVARMDAARRRVDELRIAGAARV